MQQPPLTLPMLREELQMLPGAPLLGGAPSWMIYDPVQSRFFQVGIEIFELLSIWSVRNVEELQKKARSKFGRIVTKEEIYQTTRFLSENSLTLNPISGNYGDYVDRNRRLKNAWLGSLVHSYLFLKIPLVNPGSFLRATLPYITSIFSRPILSCVMVLSCLGLYLVSRQLDTFSGQFSHLFTSEGIAIYLVCLIIVKICHELGHAYTATLFGARVSTMGIAFLVLMPVLYTDTTDAWRLRSNRQRAWIDASGMLVELGIAGLATLVWVFLNDGPFRSAIFALATTSWVLSLLVNLNPFLRFDGYYFLADFLGIQNLQPRSFALSKWWLREFLFDLGETAPEPNHNYRRFMIFYGYLVWIYRFFLFIGIALLVYALFFKALGIVLFSVEIAWFVAIPILKELIYWWKIRTNIWTSKRGKQCVALLVVLLGIVFVPWSRSLDVPAILAAEQVSTVYSKHSGVIREVLFFPGMSVKVGDPLVILESPQLDNELARTEQTIALLQARRARRTTDDVDRSATLILAQELETALTQQQGLRKSLRELEVVSLIDGVVTDIDGELHVGQWINPTMSMGTVVNKRNHTIEGYVREAGLHRVQAGQTGIFIANDFSTPKVPVELRAVSGASHARIELPYLASMYGGDIAAQVKDDEIIPVESIYLLEFSVRDPSLSTDQAVPGFVELSAERESLAMQAWRAIARVTVRELGF